MNKDLDRLLDLHLMIKTSISEGRSVSTKLTTEHCNLYSKLSTILSELEERKNE